MFWYGSKTKSKISHLCCTSIKKIGQRGCGSSSKGVCEILNHRKWYKMIKWNSYQADAIHDFGSGMQRPVPAQRTGLAEWKVKIGDCVQDLCREALFPKCRFSRNEGEWAEWVLFPNVLIENPVYATG